MFQMSMAAAMREVNACHAEAVAGHAPRGSLWAPIVLAVRHC